MAINTSTNWPEFFDAITRTALKDSLWFYNTTCSWKWDNEVVNFEQIPPLVLPLNLKSKMFKHIKNVGE